MKVIVVVRLQSGEVRAWFEVGHLVGETREELKQRVLDAVARHPGSVAELREYP